MQHIYPDEEAWSDTVRPLFYLLNYGLRFDISCDSLDERASFLV